MDLQGPSGAPLPVRPPLPAPPAHPERPPERLPSAPEPAAVRPDPFHFAPPVEPPEALELPEGAGALDFLDAQDDFAMGDAPGGFPSSGLFGLPEALPPEEEADFFAFQPPSPPPAGTQAPDARLPFIQPPSPGTDARLPFIQPPPPAPEPRLPLHQPPSIPTLPSAPPASQVPPAALPPLSRSDAEAAQRGMTVPIKLPSASEFDFLSSQDLAEPVPAGITPAPASGPEEALASLDDLDFGEEDSKGFAFGAISHEEAREPSALHVELPYPTSESDSGVMEAIEPLDADSLSLEGADAVPMVVDEDLSASLADIDFQLDYGSPDEAKIEIEHALENHPAHPELLRRLEQAEESLRRLGLEPKAESLTESDFSHTFFDLTDVLGDALMESGEGEEMHDATNVVEKIQSVDELFNAFREGVEQQVKGDDYDTHYNLGIAYKEMLLLDPAIEEFKKAMRDPERTLECCSMLAICEEAQGNLQAAERWLRQGIEAPGFPPEDSIGLRYDLGEILHTMGRAEEAQAEYRRVSDLDPDYREVGRKLA
jgi:tetratricopeptide (TPR) repeat protein